MLVVAAEQLVGWTGMPATQFSRSLTSMRRMLPAFFGTVWSIELNTPSIAAVRAHASDRLSPHGSASGLSVRSISTRPADPSTRTFEVMMISGRPGSASCVLDRSAPASGSSASACAMRCSE